MISNDEMQKYQKMFGEVKDADDYLESITGMTLNFYQIKARETAIYPHKNHIRGLEYVVLGLAGEVGEVANKLKKILRDKEGVVDQESHHQLVDEACDVLWYLQALCNELDIPFNDLAEINLKKLFDRKNRGTLQGSGDKR